ncbi:MAG: D-aminoacyl-tRNA deacylase [Longibaculum muris]|uniref:D-aminoacyl-tRNA deacylase n=1 Tax=Longibaculum muris TaxID=1796628 RepID=A0A4R3YFH2_9FIRM|nr:D-aminoacyl-tRNA deacylase [Longibaculum muris]KXU51602.1 D-tyrosyl-tRNA(Tyr) deacylase [Candidatus Stoquefichus sp. KLE1796]MBS5370459.1 D-tyrosyl-tRNA(Tyr) deacylase [Coprobacillus cateniformis]MCR1889497.1 D-aminoacyl-tRNA deacylase [Longibaculum muris]MED9813359.1 D-aminoacyl-tRNA deacylase [Longibaculum muris]TCV90937.1 D-tyrosyl-tRNA(Tyr) deacylase [Longibaculum muris]
MKLVVQRVKESSVTIDGKIHGQIDKGLMVLVGFCEGDNEVIVDKMVEKMIHLRIFEDAAGKMNLSLNDVHGAILSISQFTLYADCRKGRRPSFIDAAKPEVAIPLYNYFNQKIADSGIHVETGIFGADMKVSLLNDGPVTIILDSQDICK